MVATLSDEFLRAVERSDYEPIVIAEITLPPRDLIIVEDYTAINASAPIVVNGKTFIEGVDWTAGTSNQATAESISAALDAFIQSSVHADNDPRYAYTFISVQGNGDVWIYVVAGFDQPTPTISVDFASGDGIISRQELGNRLYQPQQTLTICTGANPLFTRGGVADPVLPLLEEVSISAQELDPLARRASRATGEMSFAASTEIRRLVKLFLLRFAPVTIYVGTDHVDLVGTGTQSWNQLKPRWWKLGTWFMDDLQIEGRRHTVTLVNTAGILEDSFLTSDLDLWCLHPLEVAQHALFQTNRTKLVDMTSLDPTSYADISHFVVNRCRLWHGTDQADYQSYYHDYKYVRDDRIRVDTSVQDILDEQMLIVGGFLRDDPDGLLRYVHWDHDAAVVRTLRAGEQDGHDVLAPLKQHDAWGHLVNECRVNFGASLINSDETAEGSAGAAATYVDTDLISQRLLGVSSQSVDIKGVNGLSETLLNSARGGADQRYIDVDTTHFRILGAGISGICGTRRNWSNSSQEWVLPASQKLAGDGGNTRYVYLLLDQGRSPPEGRSSGLGGIAGAVVDTALAVQTEARGFSYPEIIAIDQIQTTNDAVAISSNRYNRRVFEGRGLRLPQQAMLQFDIATGLTGGPGNFQSGRAGYGTLTPGDYWRTGSRILDVTIPVYVANRVLKRFKHGAPAVQFATPLRHADLEIGDFVAFSDDEQCCFFGVDGLDGNQVFEITKKRILLFDKPARIEWEAVYVRNDSTATDELPAIVPRDDPTLDASIPQRGKASTADASARLRSIEAVQESQEDSLVAQFRAANPVMTAMPSLASLFNPDLIGGGS